MSIHEAPIFVDSFSLAEWLLQRVHDSPHPVAQALVAAAMELVEVTALALSGHEKLERLHTMDELLIRLRMRVRLALTVGLFNQRQALFVAERLDLIGQQLGGWLRKVEKKLGNTTSTQDTRPR